MCVHETIQKMKIITETYQKYENSPIAIREGHVLCAQLPLIYDNIRENDLFVGRYTSLPLGVFPQTSGNFGYYFDKNKMNELLCDTSLTKKEINDLNQLIAFWTPRTTHYEIRKAFTKDMAKALPIDNWNTASGIAFPLYRLAGCMLDFEKLIRLGICGLCDRIGEMKNEALKQGMKLSLDTLTKVIQNYIEHINEKKHFLINQTLINLLKKPPQNTHEALQLVYLYTTCAGVFNYGRMDIYIGDFYVNDIKNGIFTKKELDSMLLSLINFIVDRKNIYDARVILGGLGRRNEENANEFALAFLNAHHAIKEVLPQTTLRFYKGMDERLYQKALEMISGGCSYPLLYNDDVSVSSVAKAFNLDQKTCEQYVPFGCGEYAINHKSIGSPNAIINLLKLLEVVLFDGVDQITGEQIYKKTGSLTAFDTFDDLFNAYKNAVDHYLTQMAYAQELTYDISGKQLTFLYISMLYDDCINRERGILDGGVRYRQGTMESYGVVNTADSLCAIKKLVYEDKVITKEELLAALKANFVGYEIVRKRLLNAQKYGNDDDYADNITKQVFENICTSTKKAGARTKLQSFLVVNINNSANATLGTFTAASADGRLSKQYMANANNPQGGADKNGISAMLNSLVKMPRDIHAGVVQNMKFSKDTIKKHFDMFKILLDTYFENGGTQAMISVVGKKDLEKAMIEPEKYQNLVVRVGGFSARFVTLAKETQLEILSRTIY